MQYAPRGGGNTVKNVIHTCSTILYAPRGGSVAAQGNVGPHRACLLAWSTRVRAHRLNTSAPGSVEHAGSARAAPHAGPCLRGRVPFTRAPQGAGLVYVVPIGAGGAGQALHVIVRGQRESSARDVAACPVVARRAGLAWGTLPGRERRQRAGPVARGLEIRACRAQVARGAAVHVVRICSKAHAELVLSSAAVGAVAAGSLERGCCPCAVDALARVHVLPHRARRAGATVVAGGLERVALASVDM